MATLKQLVDETTNIKNELKTCHTNLKNNLINKGVECSSTDKISNLIDKVKDVSTGLKYATGRLYDGFGHYHSATTTPATVKKLKFSAPLDFEPTNIILRFNYAEVRSSPSGSSEGKSSNFCITNNSGKFVIYAARISPIHEGYLRIIGVDKEGVTLEVDSTRYVYVYLYGYEVFGE